MATLRINGNEYYYEEHGSRSSPAIVLSPLLYTNTSVYEPIVRMLSDDYRVIIYDHRGAGKSSRPASPDLEHSARDVAELIEKLNVDPCHFVGNCLGAYVGLQLAIFRSDLLKSCTLMGVAAEADSPEEISKMDSYVEDAKKNGMKSGVKAFSEMWFGSTFRATKDPVQVSRREKWLKYVANLKPEELEEAFQIFHRKDVTKELSNIHCSVLVLAGDEDAPKNIEAYRRLAKNIRGAEFKTIHHAGYALAIEQPEEVAENIRSFVAKVDRQWAVKTRQPPRETGARP
ncbi:MAG: alpha/beta hydrolase [Bdellovibrio sp.]|nr:alpha/beta hydrolase [Bdellovibrio sp.]